MKVLAHISIFLSLHVSGQIWQEDFSNGFAGQGTNGAWTQGGSNQIWKQDTIGPNVDYIFGAIKPNFKTYSNGFMLFDADSSNIINGANDTLSACLISPYVNLSAQLSVNLNFNHYYLYTAIDSFNLSIGISIDHGNTWNDTVIDIVEPGLFPFSNPQIENINISAWCANEDSVLIRFCWNNGTSNFWAIDDVIIDTVPLHEVELTYAHQLSSTENILGDKMPYSEVDEDEQQDLDCFAMIKNYGASVEYIRTKFEIWFDGNLIQTAFSNYDSLYPGEIRLDTFFSVSQNPKSSYLYYKYVFSVEYDSIAFDENAMNNTDTISISNSWYHHRFGYFGLDQDKPYGLHAGVDSFGISSNFIIAVPIHFNDDYYDECKVETSLHDSTKVGSLIAGFIAEVDTLGNLSLFHQGDDLTVTSNDIQNQYVTLTLDPNAPPFYNDKTYLVGIVHYGGPENVVLNSNHEGVNSSDAFIFTNLPGFMNLSGWESTPVRPYIRLERSGSCISSTNNIQLNYRSELKPNPSYDQSTLIIHQAPQGDWTLNVSDLNGRLVFTKNTYSNGQDLEVVIPTRNFENGVYNCVMSSGEGFVSKKLVVTH